MREGYLLPRRLHVKLSTFIENHPYINNVKINTIITEIFSTNCRIVFMKICVRLIFTQLVCVNAHFPRRIVGQSSFTGPFQIDQSQSLEMTNSSPSLFCIGI